MGQAGRCGAHPHPHCLTAVIGALVGPALMGLTLGIVGEARFPAQVARNEVWNHAGNVASLAGVYLATVFFGERGIVALMLITAAGAVVSVLRIAPDRIDHRVARGMATRGSSGDPGPSGFRVLVTTPGLVLLGIIMMVFHFGNAPMSRLIAQQFSIQLGTPFRTTALITGVSQVTMVAAALLAPAAIRRFGLSTVFIVALGALPVRGLIAGAFDGFWTVYPVQTLDGIGAGLLGILTPVAAERLLAGTGRFNVGQAAVMTLQGIGASTSNVLAGWLVLRGGYELAYYVHGGVAVIAFGLLLGWRRRIFPPTDPPDPERPGQADERPPVPG